jgi:selenide,water dikinase
VLRHVLDHLPPETHPDLLVGAGSVDDAGVFRLDEKTGLIQTVDFFPPIVDDPYDFGTIAAANALSDVYAMGGRPVTALNVVCFPSDDLPAEGMMGILRGGADKLHEAGAVVAGGHTVDDRELKYGLAITGIVDPGAILTKAGARPGDALVLSKPLGTGLLTTALKQERLEREVLGAITRSMARLNAGAVEALAGFHPHAVTDVTGNGLLGHALEMARAGGVTLVVDPERLPLLPSLPESARPEFASGGTGHNREYVGEQVSWEEDAAEPLRLVLFDPQTSGGLLVALPADEAEPCVEAMRSKGCASAARIGLVMEAGSRALVVRRT